MNSKPHFVIAACASLLLLVTACSSGDAASGQSSPPAPAASSNIPVSGQAAFCAAALQWAQSPAAAQAQSAAQSGDVAGLVAAYKSWAEPTQAMVDALPTDAPAKVKQGFADLNDSVQTIAEEGGQSQKQADAYGAAQDKVLDYYDTTCG